MRGFVRSVKEAWEVPRDLLLHRYPPFVTGGPLVRGDVPVFVLHSAERRALERQLLHLSENGYHTLSSEEYLAVLLGARVAPDRAVVLTTGRVVFDGAAAELAEKKDLWEWF